MPSVEFIVEGVPVSAQAKVASLKSSYQRKVADAARLAMKGQQPFACKVRLEVRIFGEGGVLPDCDNVVKLVQDVLQGIVFVNDRQVDDLSVLRRSLDEPIRARQIPEQLVLAINRGNSFMYVRVSTEVDRTVIG